MLVCVERVNFLGPGVPYLDYGSVGYISKIDYERRGLLIHVEGLVRLLHDLVISHYLADVLLRDRLLIGLEFYNNGTIEKEVYNAT